MEQDKPHVALPVIVRASHVQIGLVVDIDGVSHQVRGMNAASKDYIDVNGDLRQDDPAITVHFCDEEGRRISREFPFDFYLRVVFVEVFEPGIPLGYVSRKNFKKCYEDEVSVKAGDDKLADVKKAYAKGDKFQLIRSNIFSRAGDVHSIYNQTVGLYGMVDDHNVVCGQYDRETLDKLYVPFGEYIWEDSTWRAKRDLAFSTLIPVFKGQVVTAYHVDEDQRSTRLMNAWGKERGKELGNYGAAALRKDFEAVCNQPQEKPETSAAISNDGLQAGSEQAQKEVPIEPFSEWLSNVEHLWHAHDLRPHHFVTQILEPQAPGQSRLLSVVTENGPLFGLMREDDFRRCHAFFGNHKALPKRIFDFYHQDGQVQDK